MVEMIVEKLGLREVKKPEKKDPPTGKMFFLMETNSLRWDTL